MEEDIQRRAMSVLYILRGLPASGKTTLAKKLVGVGAKRVSRDELRLMIDGGIYSRDNEEMVRQAEDALICEFLENDYDVVVDDTNCDIKRVIKLRGLAFICGASVNVILVPTPLDECIQRDAARADPVGAEAITRMNKTLMEEM
jgi:predicted kinase